MKIRNNSQIQPLNWNIRPTNLYNYQIPSTIPNPRNFQVHFSTLNFSNNYQKVEILQY